MLAAMRPSHFVSALLGACVLLQPLARAAEPPGVWPAAKAHAWSREHGWLVGANFGPSTAINQLEMFQAETFDLATIDRELGWAESLGFNSMRVFLHDILWRQDSRQFLRRLDQFLEVAKKHRIGVMFVLFDGVWDPFPQAGPQRAPKPHVHNSGWVQSPGAEILGNPARYEELKSFVQGVVRHFKRDKRVQVWDLFNEPDNPNRSAYGTKELPDKAARALQLLQKTLVWVREINPRQPLTVGVWVGNWADPAKLNAMEKFALENSDVISFHNYEGLDAMTRCVENLRRYGRPLICTEYMSRGNGSFFDPILGYLKAQNVGAYNWGLVAGKTQTIYPWDSWTKPYTAEPELWFHDIFRADGTPYRPAEVEYIRQVTGKKP